MYMYLIYNVKGKEWAYKKISTTSWKDQSCNTGNSVLLINACSFSVGHCIVCPSSISGSDLRNNSCRPYFIDILIWVGIIFMNI